MYKYLIIIFFSSKLLGQVFISPSVQGSLYDQSVGVMAGYKINKLSNALSYQIGNQYKEYTLFTKYTFAESGTFNLGFSSKIGFVNNYFRFFYPALELQHNWLQVAFRPTGYGLMWLEVRANLNFR